MERCLISFLSQGQEFKTRGAAMRGRNVVLLVVKEFERTGEEGSRNEEVWSMQNRTRGRGQTFCIGADPTHRFLPPCQ